MRLRAAYLTLTAWLLAAGGCARLGAGSPDPELRVLVYNIHAGKDASGERNLDRVAELVRVTRADLVLLQEVDRGTERSAGEDQVVSLAESTWRQAAFGRTLDYQGGEYGIAILSRWPIHDNAVRHLVIDPPQERAGGSYEPRGAQIARTGPAGEIHVLNTHLDASGGDHYRMQEVRRVVVLADSLRALGGPVLLGGDLNAEPGSAVITELTAAGWIDAWEHCGGSGGGTYPAAAPIKRIDYLFFPPELECASAEVIATETSDHRPLLVVLTGAR